MEGVLVKILLLKRYTLYIIWQLLYSGTFLQKFEECKLKLNYNTTRVVFEAPGCLCLCATFIGYDAVWCGVWCGVV
jgi:hypothetical protein